MGKVMPLYPTRWTIRKEGGRWLAREWIVQADTRLLVNQASLRTWAGALAAVLLTIELRQW